MDFNYDKLYEPRGKETYTFANWKAVMEFIGAPTSLDGNSKKKFQNNVKRYAEFHKEGYKIVIDKIRDTVKPAISTRGSKYHKYTIEILKRVLKEASVSDFSILKLAELLGCVNKDYSYAYNHRRKVVKDLEIDSKIVNEFFDATHSKVKRIVTTTLDKLVEAGLVEYEIRLKGVYATGKVELDLKYDEKEDEDHVEGDADIRENYQFLNEDEVVIYEHEKEQLLQKYKVESERELFSKRKNTSAFYRELNRNVFNRTHIRNIYGAYVIRILEDYDVISEDEAALFMLHINESVYEIVHSHTDGLIMKKCEDLEFHEEAVDFIAPEDAEKLKESNEWRREQIRKSNERYTLINKYLLTNITEE